MNLRLVEDEPRLRTTLRVYLEGKGYVVTTADSYGEGTEKAHDYDYDCIVVDPMLPGGNGLRLVRRVRDQSIRTGDAAPATSAPGIIFVTAKDGLPDKLAGLDNWPCSERRY